MIENKRQVITNGVIVFSEANFQALSVLNCSFHTEWSATYGSTLESRFRYTPTDCLETFPFPPKLNSEQDQQLETIGEAYHEHRRQFMLGMQLGLTKTYNLFHSTAITVQSINEKDKQVSSLQKHLENTANTISFDEAIKGIFKLRELHLQMDEAVLDAYGWNDIVLKHDFNEVDYLPENDRVRFTIHPDARKEVLKRLLELNHRMHEEEVNSGLWDKKIQKKRANEIEFKEQEKRLSLNPTLFDNMKEWSLDDGIYSIQDCAILTTFTEEKVRRWFSDLYKENYQGFKGQKSSVDKLKISFHGLIELVVIGKLRDAKLKLGDILTARQRLKELTNILYPFASKHIKDSLKVAGKTITFDLPTGNIDLNGSDQFNLAFITAFFRDIVFDGDMAQRIIPQKGKGFIIIDPKEANGKPAIKDKEVPVDAIMQFYIDKTSITQIVRQFDLSEEEVLVAVEYYN